MIFRLLVFAFAFCTAQAGFPINAFSLSLWLTDPQIQWLIEIIIQSASIWKPSQNITTDDNSLRFENGDSRIIQLRSEWNVLSYVYTEHQDDVININCTSGSLSTFNCSIEFDTIGYLNITSKSIGVDFLKMNDTNSTIFRAQIIKSEALYVFNQVIGWIYFCAWTISFYPQIVLNFQRKSVEGLNFDYITLNIIGFACYTAFNWALYFSDYIFNIYEKEHPGMADNLTYCFVYPYHMDHTINEGYKFWLCLKKDHFQIFNLLHIQPLKRWSKSSWD